MMTSYSHKKNIAVCLCLAVILSVAPNSTAHAKVFDPILRALSPFTKNEQPTESTPSEFDDNPSQYIDDGTDDGYIPELANTTDTSDSDPSQILPDVLFDDSLNAHDSLPVLEQPDLYALLSAEFGADRGQISDALTTYKTESFKANVATIFERALSLSIQYEKPAQSLAFARAWQHQNPDHIPAWFYIAHLALKAQEYAQAVEMLNHILQYDPHADLTEILTGIFPTNPTDQRALFNALQSINETNPSLSVLRAGLLLNLGDYQPALSHIDTALRAEPENLAFITLKMDILKASGQTDELWQFVRQKVKQMPTVKELHLYEIRHLIDTGQLQRAWSLLQKANQQTQDPEVTLLTALVGLDIGEYQKARQVLTPLLKHDDYASRANYYIAISHERAGKMSLAKPYFEKVKDTEHVLDARTKVVNFYLTQKDMGKAIATLVRLRDDYEVYATDSYLLQADIFLKQHKKDDAKNLLSTAIRENPDDDRLLFAHYQLLKDELSPDERRDMVDSLLQIDDFNPAYRLADVTLRLEKDPDDQVALKRASDISKIGADDPLYDPAVQLESLMVLANHALQAGDYQAVLGYLEMPYEVAPELDVGILLLRAYQGLGQSEKVNTLLSELQQRFAFGKNRAVHESQEY